MRSSNTSPGGRVRRRTPANHGATARNRLTAGGKIRRHDVSFAEPRTPNETPAKRKTTRRRAGGIGAAEQGRTGLGASLSNTSIRRRDRSRAPGADSEGKAAREVAKLAKLRDGRYRRGRSRFVV